MTIQIAPELEEMIRRRADERQSTPEALVMDVLREKFARSSSGATPTQYLTEDWKARLQRLASHCGVSLSDEALSSEGLYD
jgi:hypothetical protein